jgi:hypothetical protein
VNSNSSGIKLSGIIFFSGINTPKIPLYIGIQNVRIFGLVRIPTLPSFPPSLVSSTYPDEANTDPRSPNDDVVVPLPALTAYVPFYILGV